MPPHSWQTIATFSALVCLCLPIRSAICHNHFQPMLFILRNLLHITNIISLSIIQAPHTQISSCSCNFSNWTINASITLSSSSFKAKYHDLITFFNPLMDLQHKWTSMDLPYNSSQKLDSVQIDPHEDEAWIKIYIANLKSGLYFFTQSYSGGCTCF